MYIFSVFTVIIDVFYCQLVALFILNYHATVREYSGNCPGTDIYCAIKLIGGSRGVPGVRPSTEPNSFIFVYIFAEKHPRRRSIPPVTGPHPPTGNPGSATETRCSKETHVDTKTVV